MAEHIIIFVLMLILIYLSVATTCTSLSDVDYYPPWLSATDIKWLGSSIEANLTVAKDGTGNYRTITEALAASMKLQRKRSERLFIHVKGGIYKESITIQHSMRILMIFGDGIGTTIITGDKYKTDRIPTWNTSTFAVIGDGFLARDITFENTAGPQKHQAVALMSNSDMSFFYRCSFSGYQDTLYVAHKHQFYLDCDIYGTVDFIFGNAYVVFDHCNIYIRKPMRHQKNTVTAQERNNPDERTGILIKNSRITASPDLKQLQHLFQSYLTVIMNSMIDSVIDPAGWLPWNGEFGLTTLYYAEYMNIGPGSQTENRVKWQGYHAITSPTGARNFSFDSFFGWE